MLCALHNYDLATLGCDRLLGHATVRAATSSQLDSRLAAMHGEPSAPWPITANGFHDPGALLPPCGAERAVARRSHPASILQLDAAPSMSASSQGQRPVSEGSKFPINSQPLLLYIYQYAPMHI
ncbi:hypothetical protein COCC4DRAFT_206324 [Bipolaris maydis ATCC 48331]|uniref:Uncharacterized protein n=2 Tax=Cochliobolus heterostrophus TaxID=5016 RepID=M2U3I2_COCH5|nr:uncharacterized protein COCC4DRAFT_206324 [Bipolaris maydis ATCC 48331]EMD93119.1 hypothetical protein COCHEDRAFT_1193432 [Bipolaris maydis C5]ENI00287.1 hypothetical protein COCC4DRAFT_206324 [Bipolaris maydis ATCC 48331]